MVWRLSLSPAPRVSKASSAERTARSPMASTWICQPAAPSRAIHGGDTLAEVRGPRLSPGTQRGLRFVPLFTRTARERGGLSRCSITPSKNIFTGIVVPTACADLELLDASEHPVGSPPGAARR